MRLQDICATLPAGWEQRQARCVPKRNVKIINQTEVGLECIHKMCIAQTRFTSLQIDEIGKSVLMKTPIIITKQGNQWVVLRYDRKQVSACIGHGYIVKGIKVIPLQQHKKGTIDELMSRYECEDRSKPLQYMKADEIFQAGKGTRQHKHSKSLKVDFDTYKKTTKCETAETSRPWAKGERAKLRRENKKAHAEAMREQRAFNTIRVARVGLVYKSNPVATRMSTKFMG